MELIKSTQSSDKSYNILTYALITLMLTCDASSFQSVKMHGIILSGSGIIFPISYTIASVITYTYGFEKCKRSIFYMMISQLFFCLYVSLISYIGSNKDYFNLYSKLYEVILSSTTAVYTSMYVNSIISSWLKKIINTGRSKYLNNFKYLFIIFLSNIVSQFILVLISYTVNYRRILTPNEIQTMIIDTYIYKIFISSFIIIFFSKLLYKTSVFIDKIDTIDINVKYNPLPFIKNNFGKNQYAENKGNVKKLLKYIIDKNEQIKDVKILDVTDNNNQLIIHFTSIDSLHKSELEYNEFFNKYKYSIKIDELIRLKDFYDKFNIEINRLEIKHLDLQKKSLTLTRISDNKTYFIRFSEIRNNLDHILKLSQEQIDWVFKIDYNYRNIESRKIENEKYASTKLRLIKKEEYHG